jgi:hypothetical protein
MKVEEVKKLPPKERFFYWVKERYQIYLNRAKGLTKPWTDDKILQSYFFTTPYRELDKTTVWFRESVRDRLKNSIEVLLAVIIFRWFNYIPTGEILSRNYGDVSGSKEEPVDCLKYSLLVNWRPEVVLRRLGKIREEGEKIFTGAYMITVNGKEKKLEGIVRRITNVWEDRKNLIDSFLNPKKRRGEYLSLEEAHKALLKYDGLGGFMAYEIVCDLRYTYLLDNARDKMTWCNPGPGCVRGLCRVLGIDFEKGRNGGAPPLPKNWLGEMRKLLDEANTRKDLLHMPRFELREIEHTCCECDKFERLLWNDGRAKRRYNGRTE